MSIQVKDQYPTESMTQIEIMHAATPSWKLSSEATGMATLQLRTHTDAPRWVEVMAREFNQTSKRSVEALITLDIKEAEALRDWLNKAIPNDTERDLVAALKAMVNEVDNGCQMVSGPVNQARVLLAKFQK